MPGGGKGCMHHRCTFARSFSSSSSQKRERNGGRSLPHRIVSYRDLFVSGGDGGGGGGAVLASVVGSADSAYFFFIFIFSSAPLLVRMKPIQRPSRGNGDLFGCVTLRC